MAVRVDAASEDPAGRELVGAAVVDGGDVMEEVGVEVVEVEPGAEGPLAAPLPGSPPELVVAMAPSTSLGRRLAGGFGEESLSEPGDWLVGVVRGVVLGVVMRLPGPPTFRLPGSRCEGRALRAFAASASRAVWNKQCNRICQRRTPTPPEPTACDTGSASYLYKNIFCPSSMKAFPTNNTDVRAFKEMFDLIGDLLFTDINFTICCMPRRK